MPSSSATSVRCNALQCVAVRCECVVVHTPDAEFLRNFRHLTRQDCASEEGLQGLLLTTHTGLMKRERSRESESESASAREAEVKVDKGQRHRKEKIYPQSPEEARARER